MKKHAYLHIAQFIIIPEISLLFFPGFPCVFIYLHCAKTNLRIKHALKPYENKAVPCFNFSHSCNNVLGCNSTVVITFNQCIKGLNFEGLLKPNSLYTFNYTLSGTEVNLNWLSKYSVSPEDIKLYLPARMSYQHIP